MCKNERNVLIDGVQSIDSMSSVYMDDEFLADKLRSDAVGAIYEKARELGGQCNLLNAQRQYHACQLDSSNPSLLLSVGYNLEDDYMISVVSTYVHGFPPSNEKVVSGKFIGETQRDLEKWMKTLVPDSLIVRAERTYVDYDVIQNF